LEPILKSYFVKFKTEFEINTDDDPQKEASVFERFVNYVLFSVDYPDTFTADSELLDFVSVGGQDDTFIDGIGITINDRLIRSIDEINDIADSSRKLSIDFVFVQSKMRANFDISELNSFGTGVRHFFGEAALPENGKIAEFRELKQYIYSNEKVISKLHKNPSLQMYFVGTGTEPHNDHFLGIQTIIRDGLAQAKDCYFEKVDFKIIDGKQLIKLCRELANSFEVQIVIKDIFPLSVDSNGACQ